MQGVLNETTNKIHRHEVGATDYQTVCGATNYVPEERLQPTSVEEALAESSASKCGRCFVDGGGY